MSSDIDNDDSDSGYSTPSNDGEDSLSLNGFAVNSELSTNVHSSSPNNESSYQPDPNLSPSGQFVTPPEQYEEVPFNRYSEENNPYFLDDLDELTSKKQISELQKKLEQMQASIPRRINEMEKALERLQAEVSASHERIEGLRRELIEYEKRRRKRSWSWLFWFIFKHAIINCFFMLIMFLTISIKRGKLVRQLVKRAVTDFKSA